MSVFKWSYDLHGIGIGEIDEQHRHMLGLANELYVTLTRRKSEERYRAILDELVEFSKSHFETEERVMREAGYPGLEEHRKEHELMTVQLREFAAAFKYGRPLPANELVGFLTGWLISHNVNSDREFGEFMLRSTGAQQ